MKNKNLYIISGCNGAGKTTASFTILPEIIKCKEFVNADEIARGLSPFQPENVSFEAGRIMLNRIKDLLFLNESFAFETTLSTKSYKNTVLKAKKKGYNVILIFFWLNNVELAKQRVLARVNEGGHNIHEDVIERRYFKGIYNLFDIYLSIIEEVLIFDNSRGRHELIAQKIYDKEITIIDIEKYSQLRKYYDERGTAGIKR